MVSFEQALQIVLKSARPLGSERVALAQAVGRVLAEDIVSDLDMPPFNKAAMDGYACRRADLAGELSVVETIPAGRVPTSKIEAGQCAKIMTGGVVPEGADCVIMVEFTEQPTPQTIRFTGKETAGNICLQAEDVRAGQTLLRKGTVIKPQHIAVMATTGCDEPCVSLRPKVGVTSTGDELVPPGAEPGPSQIRDSNSNQLCAQVAQTAAITCSYGITPDSPQAIEAVLRKAIAENDVVILSGGVSAGDYDYVPGIMKQIGVDVLFHKIAVKPGKPTVFGVSGRACCFGLPGNPVSSFVCCELLVKPFLYAMMGHHYRSVCVRMPLATLVKRKKTERQNWIPVAITDDFRARPVDYHGSAHIAALCRADGLIRIDTGIALIEEGACVKVRLI